MNELRYSAKLVLLKDENFFGPGLLELLQRVHLCHSLHKASKEMSMAYTKALKLIKRAESNLGFKLLNQKIGGISGGGSKLTQEAKKVIALYEAFDDQLTAVGNREFETFKSELEKMRQD